VRVGTLNEPKLEAVRAALTPYAPRVRVAGAEVDSGVPGQPVGYDEIVAGARNRALRARALGACDLALGIEDGLVELPLDSGAGEVLNVGCAFVTDGRRDALGLSAGFAYPPRCVAPALERREPIGEVFDRVFAAYQAGMPDAAPGPARAAELPSGRSVGNIGKLSLGVLPRSDYARQAVLCALVRFLHPALYDPEPPR
jgi:inosine/xanthosine triphosphatase